MQTTSIFHSRRYWFGWIFTFAIYVMVFFLLPVPRVLSVALILAVQLIETRWVAPTFLGSPTFLGGRIEGLHTPEKLIFLPLGWGVLPVYVGNRNTDFTVPRPPEGEARPSLPEGKHYEMVLPDRDNIQARVRGHLIWRVVDVYSAINSGVLKRTPDGSFILEDTLIDFFEQALKYLLKREGWEWVASNSLELMQEVLKNLRTSNAVPTQEEIDALLSGNGNFLNASLGIEIVAVVISAVIPPEGILDAGEQVSIEQLEFGAEVQQAITYAASRDQMEAAGTNPALIDRIVMAERGKLGESQGWTVEEKVYSIPFLDNLVLTLISPFRMLTRYAARRRARSQWQEIESIRKQVGKTKGGRS